MATPAATYCSQGTFEVLVNDRNYVWSATPLAGYHAVVGGTVTAKPRTLCRAPYADGDGSYLEPGFTADGGGCTISLPTASGTVVTVTNNVQLLYAPGCG